MEGNQVERARERVMPLPRKDYQGQLATITMMEFRSMPGDAVDRASHGMTIQITKNGNVVALLMSPCKSDGVIHSDGSMSGAIPITLHRDLGNGGY